MKIDVYTHIYPESYYSALIKRAPDPAFFERRVKTLPALLDLDLRFQAMDHFDDYCQILSIAGPSPEIMFDRKASAELIKISNDGLAEYVAKYPERFAGFIASLPMDDPDAALSEMVRSVKELKAVGVQFFSNVNGAPLDLPEFMPLFEQMAAYDLPIWIHPARGAHFSDYPKEDLSQYEIWFVFGWPYETSAAMARIVFAGYFDRFPNLKIITHHMGGMIPFFEGRIAAGWDNLGIRSPDKDYANLLKTLKKRPLEYFKMFLADTALFGSLAGTRCGLDFFGADKVLFASDCPFDQENGIGFIRDTINVIDALPITNDDRIKIYETNARRLLKI